MRHLLICGASARAAADSAARAGFRVTALDAFADLDQHPSVRACAPSRGLPVPPTAAALARTADGIACDAVAYLSPFENHPRAVAALAAGRTLLGNPPEVLRRVRDPLLLSSVLRRRGFAAPRLSYASDPDDAVEWLVKPIRSGGGRRVRRWRREPVPRTAYLQERMDGTPGSIVFAAAGGRCVPVGFSRQLVGDPNFGAAGFRYCGSILAPLGDAQFARGRALFDAALAVARCAAAEFGLVGLNGVDFIARNGVPHPVEVNPRWCSSIEVAERAFSQGFFAAHVAACAQAVLPSFDCAAALERTGAVGKAIVYAREAGAAGDTSGWLEDPDVRDVPRGGERFRAGEPICTVFAAAGDAAACYRQLVERAARIHAALARRPARAAAAVE